MDASAQDGYTVRYPGDEVNSSSTGEGNHSESTDKPFSPLKALQEVVRALWCFDSNRSFREAGRCDYTQMSPIWRGGMRNQEGFQEVFRSQGCDTEEAHADAMGDCRSRGYTPIDVILAELGLMALTDVWLLQAAHFWNNLASKPRDWQSIQADGPEFLYIYICKCARNAIGPGTCSIHDRI